MNTDSPAHDKVCPYEGFEYIAFANKHSFVPGDLYCVNRHWVLHRVESHKGNAKYSTNRFIGLPKWAPFMFLGYQEQGTIMTFMVQDNVSWWPSDSLLFTLRNNTDRLWRMT